MATQSKRLLSLDVFRGMTIALMVLVNNPGSWSHVYPPLLHAKWHGCTPTDLVFPFFMFIVGVSLYLSFSKYDHKLSNESGKKIIRRGVLIFLIGLALNWFPFYYKSIDDLRIFGVLQRIGFSYIIAAFICLSFSLKNLWKAGTFILLAYWAVLYAFGGDAPYSLEGNLVRQIDLAILGENHVYRGFGIPFDPEGILSSFPAAVTIIFGYYVGALIQRCPDQHRLVKNLLLIGTFSIFGALVWDIFFPINKAIWTSSYVLYTGGLACLVLGIAIEVLDVRSIKGWEKPFQVFGLNPLIIYAFSGAIVKLMLITMKWTNEAGETVNAYAWLWSDVFSQIAPGALKFSSFLMALFHLLLCYLVGWILYKKKIVIKV